MNQLEIAFLKDKVLIDFGKAGTQKGTGNRRQRNMSKRSKENP